MQPALGFFCLFFWLERAYLQVFKSKKGYGFGQKPGYGHRKKANSKKFRGRYLFIAYSLEREVWHGMRIYEKRLLQDI